MKKSSITKEDKIKWWNGSLFETDLIEFAKNKSKPIINKITLKIYFVLFFIIKLYHICIFAVNVLWKQGYCFCFDLKDYVWSQIITFKW